MSRKPLQLVLTFIVCAVLLVSLPAVAGGKNRRSEQNFFTTVGEARSIDLDELREQLLLLRQCTRLEKRCPAVQDVLATISGPVDLANLPMQIVYIDDSFTVQVNKLFWRGRLTPYVRGAQSLGVLVVSDRPLPMEAKLLNLFTKPEALTAGLDDLFVSEGRRTLDAREAAQATQKVAFDEVTGAGGDTIWVGQTQFNLETETSYRLSLFPTGADFQGDDSLFKAVQMQFSNSTDRSADFGFGLGATFNLDEGTADSLPGVTNGDTNLNAYLFIHVYIKKPILIKPIGPGNKRHRISYALTFGMNLTFWDAEEFILGVNVGHLFGRHGIVAGVNYVDPDSGKSEGRPFFAFDFKF